jgi:hypothetical protein
MVAFSALVLVALVVFLLSTAASAARERLRQIDVTWQEFAAAHGLAWFPVSGPWYRRLPSRIKGRVDNVDLTIDTYTETNTDSNDNTTSTTFTRVVARGVEPRALKARVYRTHAFAGLGKLLGFQDVAVGDAVFDDAFIVKASDEEAVRTLLHERLRTALLSFPKEPQLVYDHGALTLTWLGHETEPRVLDAATEIALASCGSDSAGYR